MEKYWICLYCETANDAKETHCEVCNRSHSELQQVNTHQRPTVPAIKKGHFTERALHVTTMKDLFNLVSNWVAAVGLLLIILGLILQTLAFQMQITVTIFTVSGSLLIVAWWLRPRSYYWEKKRWVKEKPRQWIVINFTLTLYSVLVVTEYVFFLSVDYMDGIKSLNYVMSCGNIILSIFLIVFSNSFFKNERAQKSPEDPNMPKTLENKDWCVLQFPNRLVHW